VFAGIIDGHNFNNNLETVIALKVIIMEEKEK
jgi:hypothetical protein